MRTVFRGSHGRTLAPALLLACTLIALGLYGRAHRGASATEPSLPTALARAAPTDTASPAPLRATRPAQAPLPTASGATFALHVAERQHRSDGVGPTQPTLRWKTAVGGPVAAQIATNAAGTELYVATLHGELVCLALDGVVRWRRSLGDRVYSAPTVGKDGTIYVGSDAGKFFAIRPSGDEAWKFDTDEEADTAPLVRGDGSIVFTAGKSLFGLRANGTVLFRTRLRKKSFAPVASLPSGELVVGAQDHRVHLFSPAGDETSSVDVGADVDGGPVVGDGGEIYVGTDAGEVVALQQGRVRWRVAVGGFVRGPLSVARNGDVLVGTYGPAPRVLRLAAADGRVLEAFSVQGTGAKEFGIHGGPVEDARGTLYFGAQDDRIYAVGPEGRLWTFTTGADVDASVTVLAGGVLVVGSYDGFVYALGSAI